MAQSFVDFRNLNASFKKFNKEVEDFAKKQPPKVARESVTALTLKALELVVFSTAVDTGHARHNWQVGIDQFINSELPGFDKDGGATISREAAKLAMLKNPFGFTTLTNNVPYILPIIEGGAAAGPKNSIPAGTLSLIVQELTGAF